VALDYEVGNGDTQRKHQPQRQQEHTTTATARSEGADKPWTLGGPWH
jgi:hypothetical protein